MKSFSFLFLFLFLFSGLHAAEPDAPRVLTLTGAAHPKAIVQRVDAAAGVVLYAFADAQGKALDSGNSIARFTAVIATPATTTDAAIYAEPTDATLAAAIVAPEPAPPTPTHRILKDTLIQRVKSADKLTELRGMIAALDADARFEWDNSSWFSSDNPMMVAGVTALGLPTATILAPDPLAP
ncbi:MAG: hypothetical protein WC205_16965 [Opitutaceae bacterium]|jgi:hypothetical protein